MALYLPVFQGLGVSPSPSAAEMVAAEIVMACYVILTSDPVFARAARDQHAHKSTRCLNASNRYKIEIMCPGYWSG